jgi:hypothetical protein
VQRFNALRQIDIRYTSVRRCNSLRALLSPDRPIVAIPLTCLWRASESQPGGDAPIGNIDARHIGLHPRDPVRFWICLREASPAEAGCRTEIPVIRSGSRTSMTKWGNPMCNKTTKGFVAGEIAVVATRTFDFSADTPSRTFTDSNRTRDGYRPVSQPTPDHESLATHSYEEVAALTTPDATNVVNAGIHCMLRKDKCVRTASGTTCRTGFTCRSLRHGRGATGPFDHAGGAML